MLEPAGVLGVGARAEGGAANWASSSMYFLCNDTAGSCAALSGASCCGAVEGRDGKIGGCAEIDASSASRSRSMLSASRPAWMELRKRMPLICTSKSPLWRQLLLCQAKTCSLSHRRGCLGSAATAGAAGVLRGGSESTTFQPSVQCMLHFRMTSSPRCPRMQLCACRITTCTRASQQQLKPSTMAAVTRAARGVLRVASAAPVLAPVSGRCLLTAPVLRHVLFLCP